MLGQWTGALREDIEELRSSAQAVELRVQTLEEQNTSSASRMNALENQFGSYQQHLIAMQLQMEDAENRSGRNNIRLKCIPETMMESDLRASVVAVFNLLLGDSSSAVIEIDWVQISSDEGCLSGSYSMCYVVSTLQ